MQIHTQKLFDNSPFCCILPPGRYMLKQCYRWNGFLLLSEGPVPKSVCLFSGLLSYHMHSLCYQNRLQCSIYFLSPGISTKLFENIQWPCHSLLNRYIRCLYCFPRLLCRLNVYPLTYLKCQGFVNNTLMRFGCRYCHSYCNRCCQYYSMNAL